MCLFVVCVFSLKVIILYFFLLASLCLPKSMCVVFVYLLANKIKSCEYSLGNCSSAAYYATN